MAELNIEAMLSSAERAAALRRRVKEEFGLSNPVQGSYTGVWWHLFAEGVSPTLPGHLFVVPSKEPVLVSPPRIFWGRNYGESPGMGCLYVDTYKGFEVGPLDDLIVGAAIQIAANEAFALRNVNWQCNDTHDRHPPTSFGWPKLVGCLRSIGWV